MPTVLVVEPDESILFLLKTILQQAGCQVITAPNGTQALEAAGASPPDVMIIGERLPLIPATETCRRLKKNPLTRHIPIVLSTDALQDDPLAYARRLGADRVLPKPFQPKDVLLALEGLLPR